MSGLLAIVAHTGFRGAIRRRLSRLSVGLVWVASVRSASLTSPFLLSSSFLLLALSLHALLSFCGVAILIAMACTAMGAIVRLVDLGLVLFPPSLWPVLDFGGTSNPATWSTMFGFSLRLKSLNCFGSMSKALSWN